MNANMRKWFYLISGVIAATIPILIQVGVIDTGQGESGLTLLGSIGSLLGASGAVTAAHQVNKQQKEGLHDPPLSPIDQVLEAIPKVLGQQAEANANVDRLKQVAGDFIGADAIAQAASPAVDLALQKILANGN